jgi:hypothetical protein
MLGPLAIWQLGWVGAAVVASALCMMLAALALSQVAERVFADPSHPFAGLLAPMLVRMIVPLLFVVAIIAWANPAVPAWCSLYIAPLYFVMLALETLAALAQVRAGSPSGRRDSPSESTVVRK